MSKCTGPIFAFKIGRHVTFVLRLFKRPAAVTNFFNELAKNGIPITFIIALTFDNGFEDHSDDGMTPLYRMEIW